MKKSLLTLAAAFTLASAAFADHEPGHKVLVLKNKDGAAILGYDAVAYFTDNKAVKGNSKIKSTYGGADYYFASAEHKALFDANPAKYAPAYGGYFGYAACIDRLSPISPEWFQIVDGRLILQHNKKATDLFNKDQAGNIAKGDKNWPGLVVRNGTGGKTLVQTDKRGIALEGYDPITYFTVGKPQKGDVASRGLTTARCITSCRRRTARRSQRIRRSMRRPMAATVATRRASARCVRRTRCCGRSWTDNSLFSTRRVR